MDFGGGLEVLGVEIFGRRGFSGFLRGRLIVVDRMYSRNVVRTGGILKV